jgi:hypothetical protein
MLILRCTKLYCIAVSIRDVVCRQLLKYLTSPRWCLPCRHLAAAGSQRSQSLATELTTLEELACWDKPKARRLDDPNKLTTIC